MRLPLPLVHWCQHRKHDMPLQYNCWSNHLHNSSCKGMQPLFTTSWRKHMQQDSKVCTITASRVLLSSSCHVITRVCIIPDTDWWWCIMIGVPSYHKTVWYNNLETVSRHTTAQASHWPTTSWETHPCLDLPSIKTQLSKQLDECSNCCCCFIWTHATSFHIPTSSSWLIPPLKHVGLSERLQTPCI